MNFRFNGPVNLLESRRCSHRYGLSLNVSADTREDVSANFYLNFVGDGSNRELSSLLNSVNFYDRFIATRLNLFTLGRTATINWTGMQRINKLYHAITYH